MLERLYGNRVRGPPAPPHFSFEYCSDETPLHNYFLTGGDARPLARCPSSELNVSERFTCVFFFFAGKGRTVLSGAEPSACRGATREERLSLFFCAGFDLETDKRTTSEPEQRGEGVRHKLMFLLEFIWNLFGLKTCFVTSAFKSTFKGNVCEKQFTYCSNIC